MDLKFDREHIWHPYTSMNNPLKVYPVKSADGVRIKLDDGRELIDGMSSWWATVHGYNHPKLNEAVNNQLNDMSHIMFGGFTHKPAIDLAKKLIDITPSDLQKIFYCDSGSVAVEVAMKMALQYCFSIGETKRKKFVTVRSGYHGDTFHAMSVCDPVTGMHEIFTGILPEYIFVDAPQIAYSEQWDYADFKQMFETIKANKDEIAAVIIEPIVQGAGGMRFYHPNYLKELRKTCDEFGIILILDEIATGFGRTGEFFACMHANVQPDIMCIGKALTGGYMSFAACLANEKISQGISDGKPGNFMHGPTFMGNPLACSVANASLDLLMSYDWRKSVKNIESIMTQELISAKEFENVDSVRILGAIGVIQMKSEVDMAKIQNDFVEHGIWVRPFGKLVYIMPAFIINDADLRELCRSLLTVVQMN
ncbi:MAG: adenosylmethionine--8-amino-7-oxononanoate transaminase [Marinifilaceae bacterium]|jgi:adenosylmethionine-8-amino-7-oxononanoate aminotransferase|nr:adenosylmethionine--8-amino-7-oxononanoate transaminase [Marinifilaceae bacterium]